MKDLFQQLQEFAGVMDLGAPLSEEEAEKYAGRLPAPLLELYKLFNGGEIFVPGTTIYGLTGQKDDVREINRATGEVSFSRGVPRLCAAEFW